MKSTRSSTSRKATRPLILSLLAITAAGCPTIFTPTAPITVESGRPVPDARIYQPELTEPAPGNTAKVIFLRDAGLFGGACTYEILVDNKPAFAIRAGEYQTLYVAPGKHWFGLEIEHGLCQGFFDAYSAVARDGSEQTHRISFASATTGLHVAVTGATEAGEAPTSDTVPGEPDTAPRGVPGTVANAELQRDIRSHLWGIACDGRDEPCTGFEVLEAEPYRSDELSKNGKATPEAGKLERKLRREGKLHVEKWTVDCCGTLEDYEVHLVRSLDGGTDISATPLQ